MNVRVLGPVQFFSTPHRLQPARLLCPEDYPSKNTGVGCHFLPQCMHACMLSRFSCIAVWPYGQQHTRLLCRQDYPSKNTRVGCHFLLQGIFPIQGWHPPLLHWLANSLSLSHQGSLLTCILDTKPKQIKVRKSVLRGQNPLYPNIQKLSVIFTSRLFKHMQQRYINLSSIRK